MLGIDMTPDAPVLIHWRGQLVATIWSDNRARLSFDAPHEIKIHREHLAPSDLSELTIEQMRADLAHAEHTISCLREEIERAHRRGR